MKVKSGDEQALKVAVGTVGPISVATDALCKSYKFYTNGVYEEPCCSFSSPYHAGLLVVLPKMGRITGLSRTGGSQIPLRFYKGIETPPPPPLASLSCRAAL